MIDIKTNYPNCPIRHVISRFGDKWSILVLWTLHDCPGGVLRFSELSRSMAACSQKMLAATLKNLERSRLIRRVVYPEVPPRVEYSLTETGRSLIPVLATLIEWAERHFGEVTGAVS